MIHDLRKLWIVVGSDYVKVVVQWVEMKRFSKKAQLAEKILSH